MKLLACLFLISHFTYLSVASAAQTLALTAQVKNHASSYSETTLSVKAGEDVALTIQNSSDGPKEYRNWVLAQPGSESTVLNSAMAAGATGQWVPTSGQVIAKSGLIAPGANETVNFRAPSVPGEYPYFCTYPGHFMTMRGKLVVKGAGAKAAH